MRLQKIPSVYDFFLGSLSRYSCYLLIQRVIWFIALHIFSKKIMDTILLPHKDLMDNL